MRAGRWALASSDDSVQSWKSAVRTSLIAGVGYCAVATVLLAMFALLWGISASRLRANFISGMIFWPHPLDPLALAALFIPAGFAAGVAYLLLALMIRRFALSAVVMAIVLTVVIAIVAIVIGVLDLSRPWARAAGLAGFITAAVQVRLLIELVRSLRGIRFAAGQVQQGFVPNV